jgi:hypothetical protein
MLLDQQRFGRSSCTKFCRNRREKLSSKREEWNSKPEFVLSLIGYAVGLFFIIYHYLHLYRVIRKDLRFFQLIKIYQGNMQNNKLYSKFSLVFKKIFHLRKNSG